MYYTYGLNIESFVTLPELVRVGAGKADVFIKSGEVKTADLLSNFSAAQIFEIPGAVAAASESLFYIEWFGFGSVFIREGAEITVEPSPGTSAAELTPFLTGAVLSIVLHQRGNSVLHASAVVIANQACVFLGNKGDGKSTLAAHLQARGHRLISDDIVPFIKVGSGFQTYPGYPQIRLFSDSVQSVGAIPENFGLIHRSIPKYGYKNQEKFSTEPVDIGFIFVLEENSQIAIEKMLLSQAFIEVTRNNFLHRYIEATGNTLQHFKDCQRIIESIQILHLKRPYDFSCISQVVEIVEKYVSTSIEHKNLFLPQ